MNLACIYNGQQFFTDQGIVLSGGKINTYLAGSTNPAATYTDPLGNTPNANPIILGSNGRPPQEIWIQPTLSYKFVLTDASNNVLQTLDNISGVLGSQSITNSISVKTYGAKGDGTTDDTSAINTAVATGFPVYFPAGTYIVGDAINCGTKGQIIYGDGRQLSIIKASASFNLSALGVFKATSGEEGPQFRDLKITFAQPDTATRGSLISFPPALYMVATPRFTVENCAITQAMNGISMTGNSGGAFIDLLEISAYNKGFDIDGSLDSVRLDRVHFWPFDMTTNQQVIFNDSTTIGLNCGRSDDIHINDSLFIGTSGKSLNFFSSGGVSAFGNITNCDFDNYGGVTISAGDLTFSCCFFSIGSSGSEAINMTGGFVKISSCEFEAAVATTNPLVRLSGNSAGYLTISSSIFRPAGDMVCAQVEASSGTNVLVLTGNQFVTIPNTSPTNPVVYAKSGGRLTFVGNRATDKGTGTGDFVKLDADEHHSVIGNAFVGWTINNVKPQSVAVIFGNNGVDSWISYTPVITAGTGTFTSVSATGLYKQMGKSVLVQIAVTITTNGTAATNVQATLPAAASGTSGFVIPGRATAISGKMQQGVVSSGSSSLLITNYDNTYPGANGEVIVMTGEYQIA